MEIKRFLQRDADEGMDAAGRAMPGAKNRRRSGLYLAARGASDGGSVDVSFGDDALYAPYSGFTAAKRIGLNLEWTSYEDLEVEYTGGGSDSYSVSLISASIDYKF